MPSKRAAVPEGFSLVELMVAMVVTMIVVGAVYGLLSGGQSAFRVQPERTDRQQNIRSAMDLIMRDIAAAGDGMPEFTQTFKVGLNGVGPMGPNSENTDEIQILTNPQGFPSLDVCHSTGVANSSSLQLKRGGSILPIPSPPPILSILAFKADPAAPLLWAAVPVATITSTAAGADCGGGTGDRQTLDLAACNASGLGNFGAAACEITQIGLGEVAHYRILAGPDGVPNLERSANGGAFQVVARGIEDLQVLYVQANAGCTVAAPCPDAPVVTWTALIPPGAAADFDTLITQVRVMLSALSPLRGIQGETTSASGPVALRTALRGQLVSTGTPRAALFALNQQPGPVTATAPVWR